MFSLSVDVSITNSFCPCSEMEIVRFVLVALAYKEVIFIENFRIPSSKLLCQHLLYSLGSANDSS
jgi:hypothetical protein